MMNFKLEFNEEGQATFVAPEGTKQIKVLAPEGTKQVEVIAPKGTAFSIKMGDKIITLSGVNLEAIEFVENLLRTPIETLNLSARAKSCLKRWRIETIGELTKYTREELLRIHAFGPTTLAEIEQMLNSMKLSLTEEGD
ncbi:MAG: DNA-directed RNA polymerase subunit alpha C-terminal domain-containing protein [Ignavibacteriales bacterium]